MRIVSLLPSLTEIVCALGHGADLVGVTHECDYPPGIDALPALTHSRIHADAASAEVDALVAAGRGSLYELDSNLLNELHPDLILTQAQCDVCAVNEATVRRTAERLPKPPHVETVNPIDLVGVFAMFRRIGDLLDSRGRADLLIDRFHKTVAEIARRRQRIPGERPRVFVLEWLDPPYCAGHWNPEIIELAGGREVVGLAGRASLRIAWSTIQEYRPEVVLLAPCGYSLERVDVELEVVESQPGWRDLPAVRDGRVALVDGSSYFARPGPRLETSLRIAAAAIDPDGCLDLAPPEGEGWRMLVART